MPTRPTCPNCGSRGHRTTLVGSRFPMPLVPTYRGDYEGAPAFLTREEAALDFCRWRRESGDLMTASDPGESAGQAYNRGTSEGPRIAPETPLTRSPDLTRKGPRSW